MIDFLAQLLGTKVWTILHINSDTELFTMNSLNFKMLVHDLDLRFFPAIFLSLAGATLFAFSLAPL